MEGEKKLFIFYILKVLTEYSDEKHLLTYSQIADIMNRKYELKPEVKAIANNINLLTGLGYNIVKCGYKGCYLSERDFESGELMYLIDAVNSSTSIPAKQTRELIEKLTKSFSKYERIKYKPIQKVDRVKKSKNREIFYVIEVLNEAIERGLQVKFNYNEYKITNELTPRFKGKDFVINPYFLVNSRGKYYLVCNYDKYDSISNYKIECISNISILDTPIKPLETLNGCQNFSKEAYINEHIYMTFGNSINAIIKLEDKQYLNNVVDWFGDKTNATEQKDGSILVNLKVNEQALIYWALQYGEHIEIVSPMETKLKYIDTLERILNKYNGGRK